MSGELKAVFAALPKTTRGQPIVLSGKEDKKNFLYTHGNSVFIRNIENPTICDIYTEHSQPTTVAKYAPSGFYIASADVHGKVRIWDTVNAEHILKNEFQPFSGIVKDIDWSSDSQRIVVGGEGRQKFVHAFLADSGSSAGDMMGHSKSVNSVAFKPNRPFKIATASEDRTVGFYSGPPFKFENTFTDHTNFVNAVRYAPDGSKFVTGGADGRAYVYDGKTAEKVGELGSPAHKAGIYALSFGSNPIEVLSVSADKTAKIWNLDTLECVCEFVLGSAVLDMQVGCLWQGDTIITVSLSGNINYLDRNSPSSPARIVKGHNKQIRSLVVDGDTLFTADGDGKICIWDANTGFCNEVTGKGHTAQIQSLSLCGDKLMTCGIDDTVRIVDVASQSYSDVSVKLSSQPQDIATSADGYIAVACLNEVVIIQNGQLRYKQEIKYEASSIAINPSQTEVAVGGAMDSMIHIYSLEGATLQEIKTLKVSGSLTCLAYSPDGAYLATGNANRKLSLFSCPGYETIISDQWTAHTAKILSLSWSPNSEHIATGGLDTNINIWHVNKHSSHITIPRAHKMSVVSALSWRSNNELVSAGYDANVKLWNISF